MEKIALIGLGRMGTAIASRVLEMGLQLTVYNRTQSKMQAMIDRGANAAESIEGAVSSADIIITCLLDDNAVTQTSIGDSGIIKTMKPEAVHIGTATILPKTAETLFNAHREHNRKYISAAVLGLPKVAMAGKLTTFCAGNSDSISRCQQLLDAFSANVINLGEDPKAPLIMKIAMNYSLATAIELISELYAFAEKSGLDLEIIQQGLHQIYGHPGFRHYIDKIKERSFDEVNFDIKGGMKDITVFQEAFTDVGVDPKLGNLLKERYTSAQANNLSDKDWSSIYEVIRQEAGLKDNKGC